MNKKFFRYFALIVFIGATSLMVGNIYVNEPARLALTNNTNQIISSNLSAASFTSLQPIKASTSQKSNRIAIKEIDPEYAADFSYDRILVGASHNIFVGKVIQQVGNKDRGVGPETQFQVQIISNIKGNLNGNVVVDQQGGYLNGVLYVVGGGNGSGDVVLPVKSVTSYLLQSGSTYLFATRYNSQLDWYTLNPYPTASKLLSNNSGLDITTLQNLSLNDSRVKQLKAAYPNEMLLTADVAHNNILNSYKQYFTAIDNATSSAANTSSSIDPSSESTTPDSIQATSTDN